jgi:hypothetical protein
LLLVHDLHFTKMTWCHEVSILVFALSFSVESGHFSSLASLSIVARARPTFYKDDSLHGSRQALNGHLLMSSLSYFGSLHVSEGSPSNLLVGFSSVVVILWCLCFPTLICSPCVRDSLHLISLMSLHLFSDCMSFDLELYKLQIVGGVKLFIISMIFDRFVQSLSP